MDRRSFLFGDRASDAPTSTSLPYFTSTANRGELPASTSPWTPSAGEPWDVRRINHLYRRAGFGATISEVTSANSKTPSELIDQLLSNEHVSTSAMPPRPAYADQWLEVPPYLGSNLQELQKQQNNYLYAMYAIRRQWTQAMFAPDTMLREKMVFFWMNHFVVESTKVYYPQMMYRYMEYFRRNAWGNFKQMVKDVTIHPAMLLYLDGYISYRGRPNENYARELMELFTMGVTDKNGEPNYTEFDIKEIARALTGYRIQFDAAAPNVVPSIYDKTWHDASFKQPFGAPRKNYGLASSGADVTDVIDLLFEQRADQIAHFMAFKLYQHFVYANPTTEPELLVIEQIAQSLKANNWEVKPVLRELLLSEHFFAEGNIGAGIKSPFEYVVGVTRSFGIQPTELQAGTLTMYGIALEQVLLDPPNVKGWPGYHQWISTTTLPARNTAVATQWMVLKRLAAAGANGYGENHTPIELNDDALLVWAKQFANFKGSFDDFLTELSNYLCAIPPTQKAKENVIQPKLPPNYYEWPSLTDQEKIAPLRTIIRELMLLAEYQLN